MPVRAWTRSLTLLTALAAVSLSAQAADGDKKELIQKFLQLQQPAVEQMARLMVEQPARQLMQSAGPMIQQMPEAERAGVAKSIEGDARKYVDEVLPGVRDRALKLAPTALQPLLEERLTEDDLRTIIAWMESPASRKYAQLSPDMQKALGEKLVAETRPTVEPKVKALEASIAKRLGMASSNGKPARK